MMGYEETAKSTVQQAMDQGQNMADKAGQTLKDGYKAAQRYADDNGINFDVSDFVRREPWLAVTAALAIGYVAARMMRRAI